mmetsp:Transcript_89218/g.158163  ORF Transcript_89218/g.158163 Transcript_89218/m.158163 type:complete len:274 (-) Transcript_89218:50-871(-)|eukprot:CAMPEP_0197648578 /NCGR_PEP_ID=MMETSP1338-20131121/27844_1 /TAXON_ID=43686 ORGANISM="Pelagodinium beii, Strain RCC1491" /NCGR_SAMPLE_ID=MMETSP1338 /ASSEMBLY_ACC=CAM_ASM_000754 /LENGTH=273 /DNA_ID=CAMNT_0043222611 /DNA_START=76 /DNA_END=897 /DNA_ORIENTATION=-
MACKLLAAFVFTSVALSIEVEVDAKGSKPLLRHESLLQTGDSARTQDAGLSVVQFAYYKFSVEKVRPGYGSHAFSQFSLKDTAGNKIKLADSAVAQVSISSSFGTDQTVDVLLKDGAPTEDVVIHDGDALLIHLLNPASTRVASYEFYTSVGKKPDMDPTAFKFQGSNDQKTWFELSKYLEYDTPTLRGVPVGPFVVSKAAVLLKDQKADSKTAHRESVKDTTAKQAAEAPPAPPARIVKTIYEPAEVKTVYVYGSSQEKNVLNPNGPPPCKD